MNKIKKNQIIISLIILILIIIIYNFFFATVRLSQCDYATKELKPLGLNDSQYWNFTIDKKRQLIIEDFRFTDEAYSKLKLSPKYEKYRTQQFQVIYKITKQDYGASGGEAISTDGNIELLYDSNKRIFVVFQDAKNEPKNFRKYSVICAQKN